MRFNLVEKTYGPVNITAPDVSDWVDVSGCDSVAFQLVASAASSPNTANIQLVGSLDKVGLNNVGSAVNVTANGTYSVSSVDPVFRWYRVAYAIASGSYTASLSVLAKGDKD